MTSSPASPGPVCLYTHPAAAAMHISRKLRAAHETGKAVFSFEFFPPKTAQVRRVPPGPGYQRLIAIYRESRISMTVRAPPDRGTGTVLIDAGIDRMHDFGPAFIDITWGAGGNMASLTCEMVHVAQTIYGLETCMHLTCTDMPISKVDEALQEAYKAGGTNILALRGDPPRDAEKWEAGEGGFRYARDLVTYIKDKYGDHYDIGVAGYPEGCDDNKDIDQLIDHLKEKVDAGGTFIVTQMFYDADNFLQWVDKVRAKGITVPIVPGIMPIQTHAAFVRRAKWMNCRIPEEWTAALEPVKNDDAQVRELGKTLVAQMCRKLIDNGIKCLHL